MEEIHILQKLLEENVKKQENGYIDYLLFTNLQNNFLIYFQKLLFSKLFMFVRGLKSIFQKYVYLKS